MLRPLGENVLVKLIIQERSDGGLHLVEPTEEQKRKKKFYVQKGEVLAIGDMIDKELIPVGSIVMYSATPFPTKWGDVVHKLDIIGVVEDEEAN